MILLANSIHVKPKSRDSVKYKDNKHKTRNKLISVHNISQYRSVNNPPNFNEI